MQIDFRTQLWKLLLCVYFVLITGHSWLFTEFFLHSVELSVMLVEWMICLEINAPSFLGLCIRTYSENRWCERLQYVAVRWSRSNLLFTLHHSLLARSKQSVLFFFKNYFFWFLRLLIQLCYVIFLVRSTILTSIRTLLAIKL